MQPTNLTFTTGGNSVNMQTPTSVEGIITSHIYDDDMPSLIINDYPLSRQDGQKFVSSFFGAKPLQVDGMIKSVTASGLDGQIDNFKKVLYPKSVGVLQVGRLTGNRNYNVIVKTLTIKRDSTDITRAPYSAEFTVESGFGYEPTFNAWTTFSGISASSFAFDVLSSGTASYQPEIRVHAVAASQWGQLTVQNLATGDIINFAKVWTAADNMSIITSQAKVLVNGSGITYSGIMPRFVAVSGTNPLLVTAASGTQTFDISVVYTPQWL